MLRSMRRIPARPPRLARRRASSSSLLQEPPPYEHPAVARAGPGRRRPRRRGQADFVAPYTSMAAPAPALAVARASGVTLELECGARLVDGMSSWWACVHGYGVRARRRRPTSSRMSHVMFGGLTHRPAVALGDALVDVAPAGLEKVFLCDSGSVAVEVALKMAAHGAKAVCEAHDVLFVADEIATGFGRAGRGHAFACDRAGVAPDIMRARVDAIEAQLAAELAPAAALPAVADVRVLGAIGVVELHRPLDAAAVSAACVDLGVWLRPFGRNLYTMPPYVAEPADIAKIAGAMRWIAEHLADAPEEVPEE
ncbi:N2-acetyl-L-ornithine:2-oxoglutarate 5-aminotransferase [Aureococcus anophagefferens]|nr:N2-acetyl-L-ornithine:2-oxoglutarate 5-aminotransferase [Aureococcus anophagefferens]